jgi:hypothetical protein
VTPAAIVSSAVKEAIDLLPGDQLDDWQELVLYLSLAERIDGTWAGSTIAELISRQNGKNVPLAFRELYGAMCLGEFVIHTAHLFPTALEQFKALDDRINDDPELKREVKKRWATPAQGYEFQFHSGGRIRYLARQTSSGRGFAGADLVVLDEAQNLSEEEIGSLIPTGAAKPNRQLWYAGSAPLDTSIVWHRLRRRGRQLSQLRTEDPMVRPEDRLIYIEYSADVDPMDARSVLSALDDPKRWAEANPAFPRRITSETIADERASMSPEVFARERLGIAPDLSDGGNDVFTADEWFACTDATSEPGTSVAFAVDMTPDRKTVAIAVAGTRGDGLSHVEILEHRAVGDWVAQRLVDLQARWTPTAIVIDPSGPAGGLLPSLTQSGVVVHLATSRDVTGAAGAFVDAVKSNRLRHIDQAPLNVAVDGAARQNVSDGSWKWSRRHSSTDISPLVAVTLALGAHLSTPVAVSSGFLSLADV